jgi:hypothetical protein
MLATSDELAAVSSRSLATADSGLFGIPSSSSGFPGVVSGLGNLPQQTHHSRFMPESVVPVDPINSSTAQLAELPEEDWAKTLRVGAFQTLLTARINLSSG